MRTSLLLCLSLIAGVSELSAQEATASPEVVSPTASQEASGPAADPIDRLVASLSATHGLWLNGTCAILNLPAGASAEAAVARVFELTGFDNGQVTSHRVLEVRHVEIPGGPAGDYTAVLVDTNLGRKIVVLDRGKPGGEWGWNRVYDVEGPSHPSP
jgi:hypothetical protein